MWEGQKLLGTIFVRWRRKPCVDQTFSLSFHFLFFFLGLILCADFEFLEFWICILINEFVVVLFEPLPSLLHSYEIEYFISSLLSCL